MTNADSVQPATLNGQVTGQAERGASVGFMSPLSRVRAQAFWASTLDATRRGERIVQNASTTGSGGSAWA